VVRGTCTDATSEKKYRKRARKQDRISRERNNKKDYLKEKAKNGKRRENLRKNMSWRKMALRLMVKNFRPIYKTLKMGQPEPTIVRF
jgi:hypothetical protein